MIRGVFVAVMGAVVVLVVAAMVMIASSGLAMAQPAGQPAAPPLTDAKAQPPGNSRAQPSPEELKALARAAEEWVKNNPKGKTQAVERPQVKENKERGISPQEREAIGLPAPTWLAEHGKAHPAINAALEDQKKLIARPEAMAEFQFDRLTGFQGTAYVDVYLRHEARGAHDSKENQSVVEAAQSRLLSRLTAAEFSTIFAFRNTAGLTGYVWESGLEKLLNDPDVIAIGLDDQDRPEDPPRALHDPQFVHSVERDGKIDGEVHRALEQSSDGYVFVLVVLNRPIQHVKGAEVLYRQMQDRVLSAMTAEDMRPRGRDFLLNGYVNAAGLAKLEKHPDVLGVGLDAVSQLPDTTNRRPRSGH